MSSRFSSTGCCSQSAGCLCGLLPRTTGLPVVRCLDIFFIIPSRPGDRLGTSRRGQRVSRRSPGIRLSVSLAQTLAPTSSPSNVLCPPRPVHRGPFTVAVAPVGSPARASLGRLRVSISPSPGLPVSPPHVRVRPCDRRRSVADFSLLLEDPEGMRVEVNHVPGKGLLAMDAPEVGDGGTGLKAKL